MNRSSSADAALEALHTRNAELERRLAEQAATLDGVRREAAVQAALDGVRARAMAVEHGDEMGGVAVAVFEALQGLAVPVLQVGLSGRPDGGHADEAGGCETSVWTAGLDGGGALHATHAGVALAGHPLLEAALEAQQSGATLVEAMDRAAFERYLRAAAAAYPASYADRVADRVPQASAYHVAYVPAGGPAQLVAVLSDAPGPDVLDVLRRFAALFGLAHARYHGVRRAEQLARASQIEAALERVRARALAMRRSDALGEAVRAVLDELAGLADDVLRGGVVVVDGVARSGTFWTQPAADGGLAHGVLALGGTALYDAVFEAWRRQETLSFILEGEALHAHRAAAARALAAADAEREYVHAVPFPAGLLYAVSARPFSEETVEVMRRLAGAFHYAYTRHRDLERAEAQRREAVQQASVDRVRAEIAQMRTVADLDQITPLVGRELTALGVPFLRCAVFIVAEDGAGAAVDVFLATPEGRAGGAVRLAAQSHPLAARVVDHWRRQDVLSEQWDARAMGAWADLFGEPDAGDAVPDPDAPGEGGPDAPALFFAPFVQGMLFVGSTEPLPRSDRAAVQALADAFAAAYARYDDYRQLEAKTAEAEQALADLRAAQAQLVESEKLASLGAVTAGIAHEIKNPLNFINNFALLVADRVEDLGAALAPGAEAADGDEVRETLDDLKANAETIVRHGRRADAIVRGMLQHARGGEGPPEPTDLNALVEEHVALAYHGKRAQTPDLSVAIEQAYDERVGRAVVVPQAIGRVVLNLVANAFDAVRARAAAEGPGFAPAIRVRTARVAGGLEVRVEDNGTGIAPDALARVFEPFFTTKPPGAGTGLGLSISHDIVTQGHGGTLRAERADGAGAAFVMTLPAEPADDADPAPGAPAAPAGRAGAGRARATPSRPRRGGAT